MYRQTNTINGDVIGTFYPIPFDWFFKATLSYTRRSPPLITGQ